MKYYPSLLVGVVFIALLQTETAAFKSRQLPLLNKGLRLYGDSRGAGDIEIGPDPTFQCPPNTPIAPHPDNCKLYYTCYPGYPVTLWQCYSDYLFDLTHSGCNFPIEVDCGVRKRPAASEQTSDTTLKTKTIPLSDTIPSNEPTFNCPTANGFFAIPNSCTGDYYVCVSGSPYVSTCPNGSIYDPATGLCTPPESASCTKPVFTCPTPDGFYPIPGACSNSYYSCVGNVSYLQNCPGNSIFDPVTKKCTPPANASCSVTTSPTTPMSTVTTTTMPTTKPITMTSTTTSITTPSTTTSPSTTTRPTTTTPTTTIPTTTTPSTTTPTTTTPTTTTPTTTTPTTTTPTTTKPTTTTPTTTTPPTTTKAPTTTTTTMRPTTVGPFTCSQSNGYFPVPGVACSTQYYMCSNYYEYLMDCPVPTVYNPAIQTCDWSYNVAGCKSVRMAAKIWNNGK